MLLGVLVVQPNCRAQFTADDFAFVVRTLAKSPGDSVGLVQLLSDEAERDAILDHDMLYRSVLEHVGCLQLSPAFYFYILTRRVLLKAGLDQRSLTDYVAAVLSAFSHTKQLCHHNPATEPASRSFGYITDLLDTLAKAPPQQAYLIRSHLGDYTLFLSGIFAERVHAHAERRGAPGIDFYETIGKSSYRSAASQLPAKQSELQSTLEQLAAEFHVVRLALNQLTENLLHLATSPRIVTA